MKQIEAYLNVSSYINSITEQKHAIQNVSRTGGISNEKYFYDRIVLTQESNPELFAIAVENGWNYTSQSGVTISELYKLSYYDIMMALSGNTSLTSFNELKYCTGLTVITKEMFAGCTSLEEITIPKTVEVIEEGAFDDLPSNVSITYAGGRENIVFNEDGGVLITYSGLTSSAYLFSGNTDLLLEVLNGPVFVSGANNNLYIEPENLQRKAGSNPIDLTGGDYIYIRYYFRNNIIPNYFFAQCSTIKSINFGPDINSLGHGAFELIGSGLTELVLPNTIEKIGRECFYNDTKLKNVTLSENLKELPERAFQGCTGLTSITSTENLEFIGKRALERTSIKVLNLGASLNCIDTEALSGCSSLELICCKSPVVPVLSGYPFGQGNFKTGGTLVYPEGADYNSWLSEADYRLGYYKWYGVESDFSSGLIKGKLAATYNVTSTSEPTKILSDTNNIALAELQDGSLIEIGSGYTFSETGLQTVFYTFDSSATPTLKMMFSGCPLASVVIPEGFEKVSTRAFSGSSLTSITFPSTLTEISDSAFVSTKLVEVDIPDSVTGIGSYAFYNSKLTGITIGSGLTGISEYTFENNPLSYSSGIIPDTVLWISQRAFSSAFVSGCPLYGNIYYPNNVIAYDTRYYYGMPNSWTVREGTRTIGDLCFRNCRNYVNSVTLPNTVTYIGASAFCDCYELLTLDIPNSVTGIGSCCFEGCTGLTGVSWPTGITKIPDRCFESCRSLRTLDNILTERITEVGRNAFYYCESLTSVVIPDTVTSIGNSCFARDTSVTSITIGSGLTVLPDSCFDELPSLTGIVFPDTIEKIITNLANCSHLETIVIGKNVTGLIKNPSFYSEAGLVPTFAYAWCAPNGFINRSSEDEVDAAYWGVRFYETFQNGLFISGNTALYSSRSVSSITVPDYITTISKDCFSGNTSLKSIVLGTGITALPASGFLSCTNLESVVLLGDISNIPNKCFADCVNLTSITLPDTVETIGYQAFGGCANLPSITLPSGVTSLGGGAFSCCTVLSDVQVGENLITIGSGCFRDCFALSAIDLPDSVVEIGDEGFRGCTALTGLTIPSGVSTITTRCFYDCHSLSSITLPSGVTVVGYHAFDYCTSLTAVTIGDNVTKIDEGAFGHTPLIVSGYCESYGNIYYLNNTIAYQAAITGATSYEFKPGTLTIADYCLANCKNVTSIVVPSGVKSLGYSPFYYCTNLTSVTIPDTVTGLSATRPFMHCDKLVEVVIPDNITDLGSYFFYLSSYLVSGCPVSGNIYYPNNTVAYRAVSSAATEFNLKSSTVAISDEAFKNCTAVSTINIPDSVTNIGKSAFSNCSNLTTVTLGSGVTSIGEYGFIGCTRLTGISIPAGVEKIRQCCFSACTSLSSLTFASNSVLKEIEPRAFYKTSITDLTAPDSLETLGTSSFFGCSNLSNVMLSGTNVTIIPESCFSGCTSLSVLGLPTGLTEIGESAFTNCQAITSVTFPSGLKVIDKYAFYSCTTIPSIAIPGSVSGIGAYAFAQCTGVTSITLNDGLKTVGVNSFTNTQPSAFTIPDSVTSFSFNIYQNSFVLKTALKTLYVGHGITSIPASAFAGFVALEQVTLGSGITSIDADAFYGNSALTSVTCYSPKAPTMQTNSTISIKSGGTLYYPLGSYSTYSGWTYGTGSTSYFGKYKWSGYTFDAGYSGVARITAVYSANTTSNISLISASVLDSVYKMEIDGIGEVTPTAKYSFPTTGLKTVHYTFRSRPYVPDAAFRGTNLVSVDLEDKITQVGPSAFSECYYLSSITFSPVLTSISADSFFKCGKLANITLPNSLKRIGTRAFGSCSGLTEITIPDSVTYLDTSVFISCKNVTQVNIGAGITNISASCFSSCYKLTTINFGPSVTGLSNGCFASCSGLTSLILPNSILKLSGSCFAQCTNLTSVTLGDNVGLLGNGCFSGCTGLTEITIPTGVTTIGSNCFYSCRSMTSVTFGERLLELGESAFAYCTGLTEITLPNSLVRASGNCFLNCYSLTSITLGSQMIAIPESMFRGCYSLREINVPGNIESINNYAFDGCYSLTGVTLSEGLKTISGYTFRNCSGLTSLVLPNTVESVGDSCFINCYSLTSLTLSTNITTLSYHFIDGCRSLTSITLPNKLVRITPGLLSGNTYLQTINTGDGVQLIDGMAFMNCTSLENIILGSGITELGVDCFSGCSSLEGITSRAIAEPLIQPNTFRGIKENGILHYPSGTNYASWLKTSSNYLGYYGWSGDSSM